LKPIQPRLTPPIIDALRRARRKEAEPIAEEFLRELVLWADSTRPKGAVFQDDQRQTWCMTHGREKLVCPRCEQSKRASGPASEAKRAALARTRALPRPGARKGWPKRIVELHRDGSASFWSITKKVWRVRRAHIGQTDLRRMPVVEREKIAKHLGIALP
jgi:hypothetical protein